MYVNFYGVLLDAPFTIYCIFEFRKIWTLDSLELQRRNDFAYLEFQRRIVFVHQSWVTEALD